MTPQPPAVGAEKPAALPLLALIFSIIGLCFIPCFPVGLVLAIVSLVKSGEPAYAPRKTLAIVSLVLSIVVIPIQGILAAIAIPNFIRYQAKAKQTECKANLRSLYTSQKAFFAEQDRYATTTEELSFSPMGTRYLYVAGDELLIEPTVPGSDSAGSLLSRVPDGLRTSFGVSGTCPECQITVACVGNVDNDVDVDVWTLSSEDRTVNGESVPAGQPANDVSDL